MTLCRIHPAAAAAGGGRGRTGGGVEVRTDHFGIKVAAAADMKSSNELVRHFGEFLH